MTKYFTQFDESTQTIGTNLVGWTTRGTVAPSSYAPAYGTPAVKRRYLNYKTNSSAIALRNIVSWDTIDADANRANVELLSCFSYDAATANTGLLWSRGVGASGAAPSEAYAARIQLTGTIYVAKRTSATVLTDITSTAFTFSAGKSYFVRFRVNSTAIKLRVWDAALGMAGEPTTWNIDTTDATFSSAGWVGVGAVDASADRIFPWNFLAVATNGDTAVCPRTNAEFYDWAQKSNQRCIIAEMSATGYDSGGSPYTRTSKAYVSNLGYKSHEQDTPSLKHYDNYIAAVPTFSRNMSAELIGAAQVGFGELVLKNPAVVANGPGRLDDWIRARWSRNYLRMYVGAKDWPKHDFRPIVVGRLGTPTAPSPDLLKFKIADLSDFFNVELSRNKFTADDFVDMTKPKIYGRPRCVELQVDTTTLVAHLTDGALNSAMETERTFRIWDATSDGFNHIGGTKSNSLTISAVNTGTDTLTSSIAHNLQAGYRVQFYNFTLPTGLATLTNYWVLAAGLTPTDFRVTATQGSTTPVDLTSATTGARIVSFGYTFQASAGTVTFVTQPVGRVLCFEPEAVEGGSATETIEDIAFTAAGLSLNFKDAAGIAAAAAADTSNGEVVAHIGQALTCLDALEDVSRRCRVWYGFSTDGLLQTGPIELPGSTAVRSFTRSDVKLSGHSILKIDRPIDFTRSQIFTGPWYSIGPQPQVPGVRYTGGDDYGQTSAELYAGKTPYGGLSYGAAGIPIDDHPDQTDSNTTAVFDTYGGDVNDLLAFGKYPMGHFELKMKFGALWTTSRPLSIGDTVSVELPRHGWKNYTGSDDLSPDNTGDYDARLAVVEGIDVNLASPPDEQVTLRLYRPVRGYFPAGDFN